ncbi:Arc family DNA-binding protein, partial [Acinetobacter baumannii]
YRTMARSSDVEYKMRMTQELKEKILESAKLNSRSMNADIVARLEKSFENQNYEKTVELIPTETLMMELASRMKGYTITVSEKSDIKKAP